MPPWMIGCSMPSASVTRVLNTCVMAAPSALCCAQCRRYHGGYHPPTQLGIRNSEFGISARPPRRNRRLTQIPSARPITTEAQRTQREHGAHPSTPSQPRRHKDTKAAHPPEKKRRATRPTARAKTQKGVSADAQTIAKTVRQNGWRPGRQPPVRSSSEPNASVRPSRPSHRPTHRGRVGSAVRHCFLRVARTPDFFLFEKRTGEACASEAQAVGLEHRNER